MATPKKCGTCRYWKNMLVLAGKVPDRRAIGDCIAPLPSTPVLPESVVLYVTRGEMEREQGKKCPTWAALRARAQEAE